MTCRPPTNSSGSGAARRRIADSHSWRSSVGSLMAEDYAVYAMTTVAAPRQPKCRRCGMLSDDEIQALREIERRLRWHSPELVRLFDSVEPQPEAKHRQRARARGLLAAAAVTGVALLGPRMLNEAEVRTQRRQPL